MRKPALIAVAVLSVLALSMLQRPEDDPVVELMSEEDRIAASAAQAALRKIGIRSAKVQLSDVASSDCHWEGKEYRCSTQDYDLKVIYPQADLKKQASSSGGSVSHIYIHEDPAEEEEKEESSPRHSRVQHQQHHHEEQKAPQQQVINIHFEASTTPASRRHRAREHVSRKSDSVASKEPEIARPLPPAEKKKQAVVARANSRVAAKTAVAEVRKPRPLPGIRAPPMKEPWSHPDNLYMYWNHHEVDKYTTGENIRHIVKFGAIEGGEYRSENFIHTFRSQEFRDLTLTCCNTLLIPPLDSSPVYNFHGRMEHRISRFVANGNTMIFTGLRSLSFLNRIFHYQLETVTYSPGPFVQYEVPKLPPQIKALRPTLLQEGVHVAVVSKASMPVGVQLLFASQRGSPFFLLKYCEVNNPKFGEPPITVLPRDCPKWEKRHNPCNCGNIVYIGYDFHDEDNEDWVNALRASLTLSIGVAQEE